eukprot:m.46138 g.46138  ORF g.46138 m.46138 type:complete len:60 (-) comp10340_c0_seq1:98-277(-)
MADKNQKNKLPPADHLSESKSFAEIYEHPQKKRPPKEAKAFPQPRKCEGFGPACKRDFG